MIRIVKKYVAIALASAALATPKVTEAADIFNTTGSSGITFALFTPPLWTASLFHTTATDFKIESFSFQLNNTVGSMSGNLVAKIYTNSGSKPGSQVGASLGTIDTSTLSTTVSLTGLNLTLSPSTDYWLVLDNNGVAGNMFYNYTLTPSGPSSPYAQAQTSDSGVNWGVNSGIAMIGVITAVPEPGTVVMGAACVSVLAMAGYRRSKKTG
ncbi:MAG: hypothetical protein GC190_19770 [Alphaproteobacteria bacterium]|nr:hypothetical protein [Alphaproteobacteria bacterium]